MSAPHEVHWTSLKRGDIVEIVWEDHHDFREPFAGFDEPCMQRTYAKVIGISAHGLVVCNDEYVMDPARFSGGFIIGKCIEKALVWGSDA